MNESKLRQQISQLDKERKTLLNMTMQPRPMIRGSLYKMARTCGNKNCKCTTGSKHVSWYLSYRTDKGQKLCYVSKELFLKINKPVGLYRSHRKALSRIRKIDTQISFMLNKLRDAELVTISEVKEGS